MISATGTAAYGMYPRTVALPDVVGALKKAGFDQEDICMVLSPAHPDAAALRDATLFNAEDVSSGASARMIRWFSGFGAVIIPTIGFFARSERFLQALIAEQYVPALSRGSRALLSLGFSTDEAKRLGYQLCDVGALVYVSCKENAKTKGAIELLRRTGAREASSLAANVVGAVA